MNIEDIREYYLRLPYVHESFPFDEETLVFKVGSKMFGYIPLERGDYICLKCDPERAIDLRDRYESVEGAYHMNKRHWNGIYLNGDLPPQTVLELVRHSYDLVFAKLSKQERDRLLSQTQTPSAT